MEYNDYILNDGTFDLKLWQKHKFESKLLRPRHLAADQIRLLLNLRNRYYRNKYLERMRKDPQHRFKRFIQQATVRDKTVNISIEQFSELVAQPCHYCGDTTHNGLDRVDSSDQYNIDNVVPCCRMCNMMKYTYTSKEFIAHIDRIHKHVHHAPEHNWLPN